MRLYITTACITLVVLIGIIGYQQQFWLDSSLPIDEEQGGLNDQIVINFSHVVAEDTPKGQTAIKFAELLEGKTDGRIRVVIYPNGMLYNDNNELDALEHGDVEMIAPTFSKMTKTLPTWQVLDLPYLFHTEDDVERVLTGPFGEQLLNQLSRFNIKGLAFWNNGFKQMLTDGDPLLKVEDFQGLKIRAMPSKVLQQQFTLLHANPVATSFDEVYTGLENKELDAQENTISNIYSKGFYNLQKSLTITNHGVLGYAVMMNEDFYNSLPSDLQEDVLEAIDEATAWNFEHSKQMNDDNLKGLEQLPDVQIETLTKAEQQRWQKLFKPIYNYYRKQVSETFLQEIEKEINSK
ncbi:DctP family TRAP transporter solute-binding subunit [Viridibacillus sp. YIM B01967]|uniref:DctP family TRAP transporter solute-binding subunit n=1 Tax=Viridibacillus soli TaxID=2798301 RepID=A0ABS1H762_9BACL|nr:DctP family TRAP transporter solute-binding subunit [Viridibacillus soli]MBK3495263.1 DctP family TRAP transporter solute-binding subunit [Viridibacillus soli]